MSRASNENISVAQDHTDLTNIGTKTHATLDTEVNLNNAKVTNATHTGDVTGDVALTIAAKAFDVAMLADGTDGELIT